MMASQQGGGIELSWLLRLCAPVFKTQTRPASPPLTAAQDACRGEGDCQA